MSYLDKAGLTRLWAHILEKFKTVENKIPKIDNSLSTTGMAADAKAVGEAIASINHITASDDGNGIITLSATPFASASEVLF